MSQQPGNDDPTRSYSPKGLPLPKSFGRYRVLSKLGRGGFGTVYRAIDEQLQREVAVKVTLGESLEPDMRPSFLIEARIVAKLDHPHIVPVLDVGPTDQGDFYVVSKLIEGSNLADRIESDRPNRTLSLRIVEQIADALHYAHSQGLVHRDVKPANILLDRSDRPYLTDFGIALRETEQRRKGDDAGTPAYMSPEQARGLGHRLDYRSDIYSLGVVLYELLTGRRPFRSHSKAELMKLIATEEVKSPRLFDDSITHDLERICMKALARRASDRFTVARDFAEEIRWLLAQEPAPPAARPSTIEPPAKNTPVANTPANNTPSHPTPASNATPRNVEATARDTDSNRTGPTKIVPKGLRSFDASDAGFFLDLLPGPFDREGIPEALRFWKTRIEETDSERTFKVGLIYGPSGCGKSSLMKAGLLPRLSSKIISVYIEATPDDTETRLLRAVRKAIPDAEGGSLRDVLSNIRRRRLVPSGGKLLLVLDQFEQWLFGESDYAKASLTDALLQCDGATVQSIVMVREDFWISVSRFFKEMEIRIVEADNSGMVDLFGTEHAMKVLGLFGKAYSNLPDSSKDWTEDHREFLRQAIQGLSRDGKVISVQIAVLADMMKQKPWSTATLQEVGGVEGVGVTFLEEMFGSRHAPIQHRQHQEAVRGLLATLLPAIGTDIKGSMQSTASLQKAAGYENKPSEFQELIEILDKSLRLITPVDDGSATAPNGSEAAPNGRTIVPNRSDTDPNGRTIVPNRSEAESTVDTPERLRQSLYYQLAHDYLVPSLREWLTRKQRETKKGRAELKLAERATVWSANPENKQLPTLVEWFQIRRLTDKKRWTAREQSLMQNAARVHALNLGGSVMVVTLFGGIIGYMFQQEQKHSQQKQITVTLDTLQKTLGASVPVNIEKLLDMKRSDLIRPDLERRYADAKESKEKLSLAFGLASFGTVDSDYLISQIDEIEDRDTANLIAALGNDRQRSIDTLNQAASECRSEERWKRKARLALAALGLGDTKLPIDACEFEGRTDHGARTWFIHEFPSWELDLGKVIDAVANTESPALRSGICLAIGGLAASKVSADNKERMNQVVTKWYSLPDSSTHSAVAWLMREWELPVPTLPDATQMVDRRNWFVNSQGVSFVRIAPVQGNDNVPKHPYWIANREVTRGEYEAFLDDTKYDGEKPKAGKEARPDDSVSPTPDHPAQNVGWYEAVMYCNWLSRREGRTPVYRWVGKEKIKGTNNREIAMDQWEEVAGANGYRLPRELEWEYACRSGSDTEWSTGSDESLLAAYCQMYPSKLASPSGKKLPNAWGLHDMHGNVLEWCWDLFDSAGSYRVFRGGSWDYDAAFCRTAFRYRGTPTYRFTSRGFRLALVPSGSAGSGPADPGTGGRE